MSFLTRVAKGVMARVLSFLTVFARVESLFTGAVRIFGRVESPAVWVITGFFFTTGGFTAAESVVCASIGK